MGPSARRYFKTPALSLSALSVSLRIRFSRVIGDVMANPSPPSYDYRHSPQPWDVVTQAVCLTVSTGFIAMRLYSKLHITKAPGWDDWTCCLAWLGLIGYVVLAFEADRHGSGVHQWEVDASDLREFSKLTNASQILYGPLIFLTKLSIFLLYVRVFAPSAKCNPFWFIQVLIGLNFLFYLADTIVKICECTPRARIWDKDVPGHCINVNIPILVTSIVNVVSDLMMLLMPIRLATHARNGQPKPGKHCRDSIRTDAHRLDNSQQQPPSSPTAVVPTVEMAQERSGIVVGLNKGHKTTPLNTPKTRISRTKGQSSRRTAFVREIAREVVGLAPYERRIIELLRNAQDKRARKLAKKRLQLGTFGRGKAKVEDMQRVIAEARRTGAH
ncbi:hypothetical protein ASPCADRAFT_128036 [Aspergillus carbonarius ITEM 5010]|uniref:60S ribosomal protein L36 n=1 Tax=Aspergillus carbonarius (strain ITEM 5010) TaxID=602072 RepID=A0A1R3RTM8_ASPC5|nr:hypothetical protein ASPCADRAFT_128036 [Aspergillus carbonarius ITEM 5010]